MADVEQQQSGPMSSRRKKHAAKAKPQPASDWSRTSEPRPRASPRLKRHGDIDGDIVESSDDASDDKAKPSSRKQQRRRRPQQLPTSSSAESDTSTPPPKTKTPHRSPRGDSSAMRVPNASVPILDSAPTLSQHRRPTYIYEEDDDEYDDPPRRPSRPVSRQTVSRRDASTHRYRSTPESRRSPRTSVSDSEDDTQVTSDSDEEQAIRPRDKHLPPAPVAPAVPAAPSAPAISSSLQERLSRQPEMEYEEPDSTSRYAPSVGRHRSQSRPASSRRDEYRRPRDISISRPPSVDEALSRSRSRRRPTRRHGSDVYVSKTSLSYKRPHTGAASHAASKRSLSMSTNFFGDLAAPAAPVAPSVHPSHVEKPAKRLTTCVACRNDKTPVEKTVKLKCRHRMCHSCLRRAFKKSLTDPQHMPPRCCTTDHISPKHVEKLFDARFKKDWNQRYVEFTRRNSLYCPSRRCGQWISPEEIRHEGGRRQAQCSRCSIKICGSCSRKWHYQSECPRDEESTQFLEQLNREVWQRCYRCKATIELKEGSNRMTCHCGAEFCMVCGGKWKTCRCPWFKYDPFEGEVNTRSNPFMSEPAFGPSPASAQDFESEFVDPLPATARPRPSSYEEEAYLRRLQEQRDEHLAHRMRSFDAFGHHDDHADLGRGRRDLDFGHPRESRRRMELRGRGAPFADDEYHRRAATVVAPSPPQTHIAMAPPPPHSAFEPPTRRPFDRAASAFEYGAGVPGDRGLRYASPDRYDDDYLDDFLPDARRAGSPDRWHALSREHRPRSPSRRHGYPPESRPQSPETWEQLPTRYPSPDRPAPASDERRRAPSPDTPRRATSLERRLADRFKTETRQSPTGPPPPVGLAGPPGTLGPLTPLGPMGPVGPLGPLSPTRGGPPPPSRAATHTAVPGHVPGHIPGMPLAPLPHPGPPLGPAHGLRRHTMDEDPYLAGPGIIHGNPYPPAPDWFGPPPGPGLPGMGMHPHHHAHPHHHPSMLDMNSSNMAGSPRAPHVKRRAPGQAHREHNKHEMPRSSVLAGLGGMGRGANRVFEWVNYIEPGPPEPEAPRAGGK